MCPQKKSKIIPPGGIFFNMIVSRSVIIKGKVQGVNFRYYTKQEALRLGVNGLVMNQADGSVLVRIEGEDERVDALVNWCRMGPSRARVDSMDVVVELVAGYTEFEILR
jgi:acylphosphatase